jgi:hypothetical protein
VIRVETHDIEEIARLIAALPPVPEGWATAARELPTARGALDLLIERAATDADLKRRLVADLESALAESGVTPTPQILEAARSRLRSV